MEPAEKSVVFDVAIAGAGVAGVLAAGRILTANPSLKVVVLEKEAWCGGRLRSSASAERRWSYGLNTISQPLYDFWNQTLKSDPEAPDLPTFTQARQQNFGVLVAGEVKQVPVEQWFTAKGARILGGLSAAREWPTLEKALGSGKVAAAPTEGEEEEKIGKTIGDVWSGGRKGAVASVLEQYAPCFGIPEVWSSGTAALMERVKFHTQQLYEGNWEKALDAVLQRWADGDALTFKPSCRIGGAKYHADEKMWALSTEQGEFAARSLVVAQSPWEAMNWLPRDHWPSSVLAMAMKTKPVSVVVLAETLQKEIDDMPDVMLVPAENVQILINKVSKEVCFQVTLDYELSLQAPTVVKAVKSLKRARKKLNAMIPGCVSEFDHLALLPVAWGQSPSHSDRRWIQRLAKKDFQAQHLAFCGDAYGLSYDGDENVIDSLRSACTVVAGSANF